MFTNLNLHSPAGSAIFCSYLYIYTFCINYIYFREAAHYDQSDIPAIIPRILKSLFDTSHGRRIDFNVAIEVQRNLITDYISNFRQGKYNRLKNVFLLPSVFLL